MFFWLGIHFILIWFHSLLSVVSCSVGFACLQYSALTSRSFCSQCEMFFREGCPSGLSGLLHCCSRVQYSALTSEKILSVKHSSEKAVRQLADRLQHRVLLRSKFVLINNHHHQCCHKVPNGGPEKVCVLYQRSENLVYGLIPFVLGFINKSRQAGQTADLPNLTWRLYVANFFFKKKNIIIIPILHPQSSQSTLPDLSHKLDHQLIVETSHQGAVPLHNLSQLCDLQLN